MWFAIVSLNCLWMAQKIRPLLNAIPDISPKPILLGSGPDFLCLWLEVLSVFHPVSGFGNR